MEHFGTFLVYSTQPFSNLHDNFKLCIRAVFTQMTFQIPQAAHKASAKFTVEHFFLFMFRARTFYCPFIFVVVEMGYKVFNIYAERVDQ